MGMEDKSITFLMDEEDSNHPEVDVRHGYYETLRDIESGVPRIYTTQLSLLHTSLIENGYRIFVRDINKDTFEIKLGRSDRTNREIRLAHNLEKMLLAGEFGDMNDRR